MCPAPKTPNLRSARRGGVAFVLGGGGALGAHEVGMLRALADAAIVPDVILGTSVGAINGALFASDPTAAGAARLAEFWREVNETDVFGGSLLRQVGTLARTRTHLQAFRPLRDTLAAKLVVERIEDLQVPFQCVAASIERACEHWFTAGALAEAVLASCAVPGILAPVRIAGEHYIDGGIVNSIPVSRAIALGAQTVYVLQVGRLEQPLRAPRWPWEVGLVAFEVARRHRFQSDLASLPKDVSVHVLPTGGSAAPPYNDLPAQLRVRRIDGASVGQRIEASRAASERYLSEL